MRVLGGLFLLISSCLPGAMPLEANSLTGTVATWNMKWLGGNVGPLDDAKNAKRYRQGNDRCRRFDLRAAGDRAVPFPLRHGPLLLP